MHSSQEFWDKMLSNRNYISPFDIAYELYVKLATETNLDLSTIFNPPEPVSVRSCIHCDEEHYTEFDMCHCIKEQDCYDCYVTDQQEGE